MGKKVKIGKFRKDKFYQLAKEAGFRSRAAFKLLQLNRKYQFLEKSRVCIDLCAAPGGWLQVAATHMPMSSVIIGVDLAPIKSIANVITHVEDITTDKCRQVLKKDLNDNKADIVLHDGAPNVGKNWLLDAYQQNMLALQAFKLAAEFLKKDGWFVTKIFRSKDYYAIMWVFQQFFKKVEATKPQASRNESAEIFVVCSHYKAPEKIDPKFFDIKFVFSEIDNDNDGKKVNDLFRSDMNQRHRGGYPEGDLTLYHTLQASDFVKSDNFLELLSGSNQVVLDDERIASHPATTVEIKECLKDIKLLGKNEIKNLVKWRLKVKADLGEGGAGPRVSKIPAGSVKVAEVEIKDGLAADANVSEDEKLEEELKNAIYNEKKMDKKKKKKDQKEKQKLKEKTSLKMNFQNDIVDHDLQGDNTLFSLNKLKTKKQLLELQGTLPGLELSDDEEFDETKFKNRKKRASYLKTDDNPHLNSFLDNNPEAENNSSGEFDGNDEDEEKTNGDLDSDAEENPLLDDLTFEKGEERKKSKTDLWFSKDAFDFVNDGDEVDNEILNGLEDNYNSDDDLEKEEMLAVSKESDKAKSKKKKNLLKAAGPAIGGNADDDDDDDGEPVDAETEKKRKLNALELAIGEVIVNSKKAKNQLIDDSYNRYSTFDDPDALPTWFKEDEENNCRKEIPVPKATLNEYKKKFDEINSRPIKKVVEAQARKKKRMSKKLDRARKKAESLSNNEDMTDKERSREIKSIYKKAGLISKKKVEVKYVVGKKGQRGKQAAKGVKGPYRVVDRRLKKDKLHMKKQFQNAKNKSKKRK